MEYVLCILFIALVFGLCWVADKLLSRLAKKAKNRSSVRLPLYHAVVIGLAFAAGLAAGIYTFSGGGVLYGVGAATFLGAGIFSLINYRGTEITYDDESFLFRKNGESTRIYFRDIRGQRCDTTKRVKYVALFSESGNVVLQSNMQGYEPFLQTAFLSWCKAHGLDPEKQDWHDPSCSHWLPDLPLEED